MEGLRLDGREPSNPQPPRPKPTDKIRPKPRRYRGTGWALAVYAAPRSRKGMRESGTG
ncbi:hypothetical protein LX36DRAFT_717484 [Colletotrichum falcatum]|nr:hypothetical protein LX36DRAFT_717484 [Colletotrichum falcatum]